MIAYGDLHFKTFLILIVVCLNQGKEIGFTTPEENVEEVLSTTIESITIQPNGNETSFSSPRDKNGTEDKFVSNADDVVLEHVEFVQLRLKHISQISSNNITELRVLQKAEFKKNPTYKAGWQYAKKAWEEEVTQRLAIKEGIVQEVPDEYHIALKAYTYEKTSEKLPALYQDFKEKTRDVCSGHDINKYQYKSYFKLLQLAIETLGNEDKFQPKEDLLYRGVKSNFIMELGQVMAFQHFISTSSDLDTAEFFVDKTMFEIQGKFPGRCISMFLYSRYPSEQEVLFLPFQEYQVKSVHKDKSYTRYILVDHDSTSCARKH